MAKPRQEVEIKFAIGDLKATAKRLRAHGFRLQTKRTHETNVLYDLPDASLRRQGEILRLRKYGDKWLLTHKGKPTDGRHKRRHETEAEVSDGEALGRIFTTLGLVESFRYEKFRSAWTDGKGEVVIDETPIGNIGEIEGSPRWIDATAKKLGVLPKDYSTKSYAELFFDWQRRTGNPANEMTFRAVSAKRTP
jgi:adenylate cyclase, class 2